MNDVHDDEDDDYENDEVNEGTALKVQNYKAKTEYMLSSQVKVNLTIALLYLMNYNNALFLRHFIFTFTTLSVA